MVVVDCGCSLLVVVGYGGCLLLSVMAVGCGCVSMVVWCLLFGGVGR